MAIHDSYSRWIAWLKVLLPLMALAILSTLFLLARRVDPVHDVQYTDTELAELVDRQLIRNPRYIGVTSNGVTIRLAAENALLETASPESAMPDLIGGRAVSAEVDIPDGDRIDVFAGNLRLDVSANLATFDGGVRIESQDGYVLGTEAVRLALDAAQISSDTQTTLSAPIGRIVANGFQMKESAQGTGSFVLVFAGDVKMQFEAGRRGAP